jgi:hypothetical protein
MSIDTARLPTGTLRTGLAVPWLTVLPLAVVLAYADGFWMLTMRGAVGAIERTQQPFDGWWRESTIALPLYVLAVLGSLTLAKRWFGPALRTTRTVLVTALLVALAGTIVGIAELVASSIYDYSLQSAQLAMMDAMHGICVASCLDQAQQSTLGALVRAVLYVGGFLLATNIVLVGWVVAMRGGRVQVARLHPDTNPLPGSGPQIDLVRLLLVAGLIASAHIHAAVIPVHLGEWPAAGGFFALLTVAEVAVAAALLAARPRRLALIAAVVVSAGPLLVWLYSRTLGLPFGPDAGISETVGIPDVVCCALEIGTLIAAVMLLRRPGWLRRRPPASAHVRGLAVVAVVAVTALGLAAVAPSWIDGASDGQPVIVMTH